MLTYLLYEGIEPVDLAAIGVMSMAKRVIPQLTYETVAATNAPVVFSNGLRPKIAARRALAIDEATVVTGGGMTLCIDTALHLLERRYGSEKVDEVARIMEYGAARRANRSRFLEVS